MNVQIDPQLKQIMKEEGDSWDGEYYGLNVRIRRHPRLLHLCGYVKVPKESSLFGKDMFDIDVDVHGGVTYARDMEKNEWWVGFDCAHLYDITPGLSEHFPYDAEYRDMEYVKRECNKLAEQIYRYDDLRKIND